MKEMTVAAVQMFCNRSVDENIAAAEKLVRQAADEGSFATGIV